jgi:hypothetical protein
MDEQAMLNRLKNVNANSMVEYAKNLAATEGFSHLDDELDNVEETFAIAT